MDRGGSASRLSTGPPCRSDVRLRTRRALPAKERAVGVRRGADRTRRRDCVGPTNVDCRHEPSGSGPIEHEGVGSVAFREGAPPEAEWPTVLVHRANPGAGAGEPRDWDSWEESALANTGERGASGRRARGLRLCRACGPSGGSAAESGALATPGRPASVRPGDVMRHPRLSALRAMAGLRSLGRE